MSLLTLCVNVLIGILANTRKTHFQTSHPHHRLIWCSYMCNIYVTYLNMYLFICHRALSNDQSTASHAFSLACKYLYITFFGSYITFCFSTSTMRRVSSIRSSSKCTLKTPVWLHRALSRAFVDDACCQHDICFYANI